MQAAVPLVLDHHSNVALLAGELVANRIRGRPDLRLILPSGRTPLGLYAALRAHATDGSLPSTNARLFQLDEYLGLGRDDARSFSAYLRRELEGVRFGELHELDGAAADPEAECARHQAVLDRAPIDLVVLGIGRDGHVAFDEPGSAPGSGVRRVRLDDRTRSDAVSAFGTLDDVPREALTVGLRTLLGARAILLLASGEEKAEVLRAVLEDPPGRDRPASLLRSHPRLTVICDRPAARLLASRDGDRSDRAIVVLGHRDPKASPAHRISDESQSRILRAARECRHAPPRVVVLTGYTRMPAGFSEAEQMKAEWPLPDVPTLLEIAGRNTAENASRSLPLIRAVGDIRRVTVVTSAWHVRAPYFFAPYRALGLRLSFAFAPGRPRARWLAFELAGAGAMRGQRRAAMAQMRLPPQPALAPPGAAP